MIEPCPSLGTAHRSSVIRPAKPLHWLTCSARHWSGGCLNAVAASRTHRATRKFAWTYILLARHIKESQGTYHQAENVDTR